ncbi:tRNA1(Val) (adenine(37)-N6)-methyltransferase [Paracoccus beibuensis]|uniref:tRNA1(Val) (adenine(37)-N6)-methyltransferase n=1 Tax=Paracoccus beibuensis TaxID=547602 RepID=UPI002240DEE7|nr:methyltransferase [Paracoccus beibuensis]
MTETRIDGFLDGRLRIAQPARGYRSGADAVMLAAACPARPGQSVLELGCGAGVASLCLGWRVPGLTLTGLERQADYAALAADNATANGIALEVLLGDLAGPPPALRDSAFDHVMMNPPYFLAGTAASDRGRAEARQEETPLAAWIDAGLRRLRPGGWLTLIQRADRMDAVIRALGSRAGALSILPVAARHDHPAGRVMIVARKGSRSPMRLLAPFVMHAERAHLRDGEDLTPGAADVLRNGAPIEMTHAKVS